MKATVVADRFVFYNDIQHFLLVFPESWKGYKVVSSSETDASLTDPDTLITFSLPSADTTLAESTGYANILKLAIFSQNDYLNVVEPQMQNTDGVVLAGIVGNFGFVFSPAPTEKTASDHIDQASAIPDIIKTLSAHTPGN